MCTRSASNGLFTLVKEGGSEYVYRLKVKLRKNFNRAFAKFSFRYSFYDFQVNVVNSLILKYQDISSQVIILPPGGGKTIIALQIASILRVNTLILVPNLAVMGSWFDRAEMFFDRGDKGKELRDVMGKDDGALRPLTIMTYQRLNNALKKYRGLPKKKTKLRKNSENIVARLFEHKIGFIIIDEAHKLTSTWGEMVKEFYMMLCMETEDVRLLGLTATPPRKKQGAYELLFEDSIQIELPPLVREGIIAPYRDLICVIPAHHMEIKESLLDVPIREYVNHTKTIREFIYRKGIEEFTLAREGRFHLNYTHMFLYYALKVLDKEFMAMGEQLRALMLYDTQSNKRDGYNSIFDAFYVCIQDENIDKLNPILLTSTSLLVDDDFTEEILKLHRRWSKENSVEIEFNIIERDGYFELKGKGRDNSTDSITRFITYVFESGRSKLLIGTRYLLGEGWDALHLNTILDMTFVAKSASVNQLKGRAFRMPPGDKSKVANIWEFVIDPAINKDVARQYLKFVSRHDHYYGIDKRGDIRSGIKRIDRNFPEKKEIRKQIRTVRLESISNVVEDPLVTKKFLNREMTRTLWKVGEKIGEHQAAIKITLNRSPQYWNENNSSGGLIYSLLKFAAKRFFDISKVDLSRQRYYGEVAKILAYYIKKLCRYFGQKMDWSYDREEIIEFYPEIILSVPISRRFSKHSEISEIVSSTSPPFAIELTFINFHHEREVFARWIEEKYDTHLAKWFSRRMRSSMKEYIDEFVCYLPLPDASYTLKDQRFFERYLNLIISNVRLVENPNITRPIEIHFEARYKS